MVSKINTTFKCSPLFPRPFLKAGEVLPHSGRDGGFTLSAFLFPLSLLRYMLSAQCCPLYSLRCPLYALRCSLSAKIKLKLKKT